MSFFGRLFGSPDATREAIGAVRDGLDALVYTKEEQAADDAASVTQARQVLIEWIKNSQGQNLSRRFLAFIITSAWLWRYDASGDANTGLLFCSTPHGANR